MNELTNLLVSTTLEDATSFRSNPPASNNFTAVPKLRKTFDHLLFLRTICDNTSGHNLGSEHPVPGLSDVEEGTLWQLRPWLRSYGNNASLNPTPFISVTPDPLRALNRATQLESDGCKNIEVILIDGWNLPKANIVRCNELREVLGLLSEHVYDTEYLVWKRNPSTAMIQRWPWDTIRSALDLFFPALIDPTFPARRQRQVADLRNQLCSGDPGPGLEPLVEILNDKLDPLPQNLTTKQIAMIMLGWTRCKPDTRYFVTLEKGLEDIIPDKIAELDYRLYAKTCQWNKDRQQPYVRTFNGNLNDLKSQLRTAIEFNIQTYDDWLAERSSMEERAGADIQSVELAKSSLLSILKFKEVSFRLPPSKRQRRILTRASDINGLNL